MQARPLADGGDLLPLGQEAAEGGLADRAGLPARGGQAAPPDHAEDLGVAVLGGLHALTEAALDDLAGPRGGIEHGVRRRDRQPEGAGQVAQGEGPAGARPAGHQLIEGVDDGVHLGRHARRDGHAQAVAQQRGVGNLGEVLAPGEPHGHHAPGKLGARDAGRVGEVAVVPQLLDGDGAEQAQHVGELLGPARAATVGGALQLGVGLGDDLGVEQLAQLDGAQQLGQQRRVQGEGGGALLGGRGVALVHEGAGVVEQQRGGEGAGLLGGDLGDAHAAQRDRPQHLL